MTSMARKTTRRRDDTWVVKEDEFHPDPKVAARQADGNARVAAIRSLKEEHERQRSRLNEAGTTNSLSGSETKQGIDRLDAIAAEIRRVEREVREAEEEATVDA
jgi:hypothetical protein